MKQQYDFWYSKEQATRLRQRPFLVDNNGKEEGFKLTEFLVDGEWHEYTEMRTSGKKPISQYDDMQKLGTGTTSDTKIDGERRARCKMTQEQPTPGALRTAEAIQMEYFEEVLTIPRTIHLAAIIDRETAAADLLNALEDAVEDIKELCKQLDDRGANVQDIEKISVGFYETTIAKAKGKKC